MKLAVFGKTGQVATELRARAPKDATLMVLGRSDVDFTNPQDVHDATMALQADAIINAVAYTAVDRAEDEVELANLVNGLSVKALGQAAAETHTPLVHISTDYVFPGGGTHAWEPNDATGPLGVYGSSKLLGEQGLRESGAHHITLRTSWVFSAYGRNFVKTMLRLGTKCDRLTIVADQVGGPTPAAAIADASLRLAKALKDGHAGGTYHFSGAPDVSWADFAREIFRQHGLATQVTDIPTSEFKTRAERPLNSRMDCSATAREFGIARPDWRIGLTEVLAALETA